MESRQYQISQASGFIPASFLPSDLIPHLTRRSHVDSCFIPGGGVLPYIGYISMCGPKGYGFSAVLVINRISILADFGHFGHK